MAEEFHTGVCSGSWPWNAMRGSFEGAPMSAAACSAAASDAGSFGWGLEMMESKTRSDEESAGASASGGSTFTFLGSPGVHASDPMAGAGGFLMEQTVPVAGSGVALPSMDWNQANSLRSNRKIGGGFQAMLQDNLSSSRPYLFQETSMDSDQTHKGTDNQWNRFKDFNQAFMTHQTHLNSGGGCGSGADAGFQGVPFACPPSPTLLHDLLDQDMKPQTSTFNTSSANFMSPASYRSSSGEPPRFPHFLKSSPLRHQHQLSSDHLQFSSENPSFWNASTQAHFSTQQAFDKPSHSATMTGKPNSEGARDSSSTTAKKSASNEPAFKKTRIETPSPLPTFKVRKEKLGDRITALQQLVSPFGKTDTASVLHEAIEYIKFLHDQVGVLSTPYLKNGPAMQHNQKPDKFKDGADGLKQDLRSRGLCLVPVSATFPVVSEPTTADFWTPTFGGTYR
ncbi:hypothetical protein Taro_000393 [Colocasia esculenta]|uniref:BHLH domain-containing protein n=1 Tax=Colocasia esculenta TaxID=4460 RepID=A0A843TCY5_COLES|nr:hypothetical protein [Colocasia esculenta]